ncbi:MAG: hypothetical protein HGA54_05555 [Actinobacteria bacterium]|nr:hypothetical protein [Actinomycetota bacterium]
MRYKIYPSDGGTEAPCIYFIDSKEGNFDLTASLSGQRVTVVHIFDADWNHDLSPWPAQRLYKRDEADFAGNAEAYVQRLEYELVPLIEQEQGLDPLKRGLVGYSIAGLFALFAATKTGFFDAVASVSGSLWFDDWVPYLEKVGIVNPKCFVYLSIGDREKLTGNARLACVEERTVETLELLKSKGIVTEFRQTKGAHIEDVDARLRLAFETLTQHL